MNCTEIEDWKKYSDLLLYGVIDRYYRGDPEYKELWNRVYGMFDGKGMVDRVFNKTFNDTGREKYETYKLALFVIAAKIIGNQTWVTDSASNTLWNMQNKTNGGITTHYLPNLLPDPDSKQNIETTCLAIYSSIPADETPIPEFPSSLILPLFILATLLIVILYRRKPKKN